MTLDSIARLAIWQAYEESRPKPGPETDRWVESFAAENGFPPGTVRRVIAEGAFSMLQEINQRSLTVAQEIAQMMGATMAAAFEMLRAAYHATKKSPVLYRGEIKLIDPAKPATEDNIVWLEVPDWHARLSAIRSTIEIYGARAPQQFEVNTKSVVLNLSPQDALAELQRLAVELPRLQRAYSQLAGADEESAGAGSTVEGTVGG